MWEVERLNPIQKEKMSLKKLIIYRKHLAEIRNLLKDQRTVWNELASLQAKRELKIISEKIRLTAQNLSHPLWVASILIGFTYLVQRFGSEEAFDIVSTIVGSSVLSAIGASTLNKVAKLIEKGNNNPINKSGTIYIISEAGRVNSGDIPLVTISQKPKFWTP